MTKKPFLKELNENLCNSPLVRLFLMLLFNNPENPEFEIDEETKCKYYILNESFENMVFSNGSLDPDDQFHVYDTINTFQNKTTFEEKESIIFQFLDSEQAMTLIYETSEENPDNLNEHGYFTETDKIFNKTRGMLLQNYLKLAEKGSFQKDVYRWLSNLCYTVSINFIPDETMDDENLLYHLNLFLDGIGVKRMLTKYPITEGNAQILGETEFTYGGTIFKIDRDFLM